MKKTNASLILSAILCVCCTACTSANADGKEPGTVEVDNGISVKEGFYLSETDDSYIEVKDKEICIRNYDCTDELKAAYDEIEGKKVSFEEFSDNSTLFKDFAEMQEFVPVRFTGMGENGEDLLLLTLNYDFAAEKGAYNGYVYVDENTLETGADRCRYVYGGTETPAEAS